MITRALPSGLNKVYMRAWINSKRQIGQNPGANHMKPYWGCAAMWVVPIMKFGLVKSKAL